MSRLVGFASSMEQHVELAFKRDTVGLQTKEQFAEKVRLKPAITPPCAAPVACADVRARLRLASATARGG